MGFSLRFKVVLITVAILVFAVGSSTLASGYFFTKEYSDALQSRALVIGQSLKSQLVKLLGFGIPLEDLVGFEKQCQGIVDTYEDIAYAMVVDIEGKILFHNDPSQHNKMLTDAATLAAVKGTEETIQVHLEQGATFYAVIIPVFDPQGEHVGAVMIGFPAKVVTQRTEGMALYSIGAAFISLGLAITLFIFLLSAWVTKPLAILLAAIQEIREGETQLASRVEIDSKDEIGQLASAFNQMIDDLRESHEKIREYTQELELKVNERTNELKTYAAQLERSNRELESFAYVASHDLQEPLRKIQTFGDRLKAKYGDILGDKGYDYLERMQSAAARMQALINGLLAYSRVTTKAQPFALVDIEQVVRNVVSDLEVRIQQSGGRVEIEDLPTIQADPTQMRQLFQNLIANALKFHRPGEPPLVKVYTQTPDDGYCRIVVEDNGIGFDEKYVDRIFQVFQRLQGRSEYEGTGIGLATCRKIVERHGGCITAHSKPGHGATFTAILPLTQLDEEQTS